MKKTMLVGLFVTAAFMLKAADVTTEGTVTTFNVPEGETYTHPSAIASPITKYIKTGKGTLEGLELPWMLLRQDEGKTLKVIYASGTRLILR